MRLPKDIKLPVTGWTASIVTYFTFGERELIMGAGLADVKATKDLASSLSLKGAMKMQKKNIELGLRKLQDQEGKEVKVTLEVIADLPESDAYKILESLPEREKK